MKRFICVWFTVLLLTTPSHAQFENAKVIVDTQTEKTPVNNAVRTAPLLNAGDTFVFQVFIEDFEPGAQTVWFQIDVQTDLFVVQNAAAFNGTPMLPSEGGWAALIISGATIPSSGFLAAFVLTATQDIPDGTTLAISQVQLTTGSLNPHILDVSRAEIRFTSLIFIPAIGGDIDFDGDVDFSDFVVFASNFGKTGAVPTDPATLFSTPPVITLLDTVTERVVDTVFVTNTRTITKLDTIYLTRIDTLYLPLNEIPPPITENPPSVVDSSEASISLDANLDAGYNNGRAIPTGQAGEHISFEIYGHSGLEGQAGYGVVIELPPSVEFASFSSTDVFAGGVPINIQTNNIIQINVTVLGGTTSKNSGTMGTVTLVTQMNDAIGTIVLHSASISGGPTTIQHGTITLDPNLESPSTPVPPTSLQATYNANNTPIDITLSWTPPSSFDSFLIQRAEVNANDLNLAYTTLELSRSGTTYTDSNIQSGIIYAYRVSTNLSGSISDPSDVATVVVP